jgi:transposase-like protein
MRLVGRMFVGVRNKAVYFALGVQADRMKDILGLWIENTEGAKFWLRVMRTS